MTQRSRAYLNARITRALQTTDADNVAFDDWLDSSILSGDNEVYPPHSRRFALLGTSLTQHNHEASGASDRLSTSSRGWMTWANAYSGGLFDIPVWFDEDDDHDWGTREYKGLNFGVSSQTTSEIIDRLDLINTRYINDFTDIIIEAGTNDVASLVDKETVQTNRETIVNYFLDRGKRVYLLPILSRSTGEWSSAGQERYNAHWINQKSLEFCNATRNCFYLDWSKPWVDGTDADGVPRTGYSDDGVHFSTIGAENVGEYIADYFKAFYPLAPTRVTSSDDIYDATHNPLGSIIPNPMALGTGGGRTGSNLTGDVADDMRVRNVSGGATVACSKETRSDGRGEYQVLTITNVPSGSTTDIRYATSASSHSHSVAGQWIKGSCEIVTNDTDMLEELYMYIKDNGTGGEQVTAMHPYTEFDAKARSIFIETPPMLLKGDSSTITMYVRIGADSNGKSTAPIIKIGAMEIRPISDPRLGV